MKLLLLEDEKDLLLTLTRGLELDGYYVDAADCGKQALDFLSSEVYDLIILDLNLPDMSGFDILRQLKKENVDFKVLILTSNDDIESKSLGFNLGASDYLSKPFHFKELELRISALLRRKFVQEDARLSSGDLTFDTAKRELFARGKLVQLTKKETAIIEYFMMNKDKIISAEDLLSHAWDSNVDFFSNSIRVHLTSLRKKIKNELGYNPISNKIGEGYYLTKNK